jgi:hypothetical protein
LALQPRYAGGVSILPAREKEYEMNKVQHAMHTIPHFDMIDVGLVLLLVGLLLLIGGTMLLPYVLLLAKIVNLCGLITILIAVAMFVGILKVIMGDDTDMDNYFGL